MFGRKQCPQYDKWVRMFKKGPVSTRTLFKNISFRFLALYSTFCKNYNLQSLSVLEMFHFFYRYVCSFQPSLDFLMNYQFSTSFRKPVFSNDFFEFKNSKRYNLANFCAGELRVDSICQKFYLVYANVLNAITLSQGRISVKNDRIWNFVEKLGFFKKGRCKIFALADTVHSLLMYKNTRYTLDIRGYILYSGSDNWKLT